MLQAHAMLPHQGSGAGQAIEVRANVNKFDKSRLYLTARTHTFSRFY